ncbi:ABC transporter permease [Eoetvoesiella caeni]
MNSLSRKGRMIRGTLLPAILLALAEITAQAVDLRSDSLAAPSTIVLDGYRALIDGTILIATQQTLGAALAGLALGGVLGLALGILLGLYQHLDELLEVSIEVVRPIPSVALIPVAMLVFGFGYKMEISIVAFSTVWPMLILSRSAVASVQPRLMEVSRALGLSFGAKIWKIILPAVLPRIFVAFRLATGIALIVAVTVEIAANPLGLGYSMMVAQQSLKPGLMFAMLVWIGLIGWGLNTFMLAVQRHLFAAAAPAEQAQ